MASLASKDIVVSVARNRNKRRSSFVFDPAVGALVVRPDLRKKTTKAIMAHIKRAKRDLYLRKTRLQITLFTLKFRYFLSKSFRYFFRFVK